MLFLKKKKKKGQVFLPFLNFLFNIFCKIYGYDRSSDGRYITNWFFLNRAWVRDLVKDLIIQCEDFNSLASFRGRYFEDQILNSRFITKDPMTKHI